MTRKPAADWTEEDWRDLHVTIEAFRARVRQRFQERTMTHEEKQAQGETDAEELKSLVFRRTHLLPATILCPREKSAMTPCVVRDGKLAVALAQDVGAICVGCEHAVEGLLALEKERHQDAKV